MTDWLWLPSGVVLVGWLALRRRLVLSVLLLLFLAAGLAWVAVVPQHADYLPGLCEQPFDQACAP